MSNAPALSSGSFAGLFQAVSGLRNRHALAAMLGCLFAGVLLSGLLGWASTTVGMAAAFLGGLVFVVAVATGVNAAGLLLMDQARGVPPRPLVDAVVYGVLCIPRQILLALALLLVALAVFIGLALLFLVAKIPYLGALLFVAVFPLSVVIAGVTTSGLLLCLVLALPAIWEGSSISRAIVHTLAVARTRLVEALLMLAVVGVLSLFVGFIVFGVLGLGWPWTLGLTAWIIGDVSMLSMPASLMDGEVGGHTVAGGIGAGLLWALAATLVAQVYLLGLNLVYLRLTEGLDTAATEAAVRGRLQNAKRRTTEMADRARNSAARSAAASPAGDHAALPPVAPLASSTLATDTASCPQCRTTYGTGDLFCGVCGHRLT